MNLPHNGRIGHPAVSSLGMNRRQAIGRLTGALLPTLLPGRIFGADAPSKRVALGFIGVGSHGFGHNLKSFLVEPDAQAVAVCDVLASQCKKAKDTVDAKYGDHACRQYADFREILGRKDIDAVVISTPDHWHVPISLMALEVGKDVFCEKPTLTIAEGRALADSVARHKAVLQIGIEDRSIIYYHKMAELARNGALGKLQAIRVKLPGGGAFPKEQPVPPPAELNWPLWLGPAPFHEFTPTISEPMHWRQVRDFSGGLLTDWGAHLLDTAQVANSAELSGPVEVEGHGEVPKDSMVSTFSKYSLRYRYANGVELFVESGGVAIRIEGTDGWVANNGWRGPLQASSQDLLRTKFPAETNKIWAMPPYEHRNFLDCAKSRKPTTYTAETGHRLSTVMHIGNIAMELGRKLKWDPQTESFVGDDAANALRSRVSRDDWKKL